MLKERLLEHGELEEWVTIPYTEGGWSLWTESHANRIATTGDFYREIGRLRYSPPGFWRLLYLRLRRMD